MSVAGIGSSGFYTAFAPQGAQSPLQQIQTEFQQLGQDLQSGNLTQAQQEFSTLTQSLQSANPATTNAAANATTTWTAAGTVSQELSQLGKDLQSGNTSSAQQDFTTLQNDLQQQLNVAQSGGHHHHHHVETSNQSSSQQASSQPTNPISAAFGALTQFLQSGNLSGAQSAYSTLQSDLQQIGGFTNPGLSNSAGASEGSGSTAAGTLSVTA
jgi:hypothetical protein